VVLSVAFNGRSLTKSFRDRFWSGIRAGLLVGEAAAAAGVSRNAGRVWFAERGGVKPPPSAPAKKRPRLTFEQREEIALLKAEKKTNAEIARAVGCHRSTIGHELEAGSTTFPDRKPRYRASVAQAAAEQRATRSKPGKLATNPRLREEVQARLTVTAGTSIRCTRRWRASALSVLA
jgi:transposase